MAKWIKDLRAALDEGSERTKMSIEQKREAARLMKLAFFRFSNRSRELAIEQIEESRALWSDDELLISNNEQRT